MTLFLATATALPAFAGGIGVVDFQQAVGAVSEGTSAEQELEAMYQQKQQAIAELEAQLTAKTEEYERQRLILSETARQQKEQEILQLQATYQQAGMQAEMEMQQLYTEKMQAILAKMRQVCEKIGQERELDLIIEVTESGVLYHGAAVVDITADLITRYDAN